MDGKTPRDTSLNDDEVLIRQTLEYFSYSELPTIGFLEKSSDRAIELINKGNEAFIKSPQSMSTVEIYTEALANVPNSNNELLARCYANRSAVLCNCKFYKDSLKDIDKALEVGYPDHLKSKLYARRAKNLSSIDPKMHKEIKKAVASARYWMEKIDNDADKNKIRNSLDDLKKNHNKTSINYDTDLNVPAIPLDNDKILRASSAIAFKYSKEFGRHIVATRDIEAGESLSMQKIYASTLLSDCCYTRCWNCSKQARSSVPCSKCTNVIFCDEICRDSAWNEYHDVECKVISAMPVKSITNIDIIGLRVTIKAYKEAGDLSSLKKNLKEIDSLTDPITRGFTESAFDETKYASVYTLNRRLSTLEERSIYCVKSAYILQYLAAVTEILGGKKFNNYQDFVNDELAVFLGALLFINMVITTQNAFKTLFMNRPDGYEECYYILMPLVCLYNHSCDENVIACVDRDISTVCAVDIIKKGQQLFINYGQPYLNSPTIARRQHLKNYFGFTCECIACVRNWGPGTKFPSYRDLSIPREIKNNLAGIEMKIIQLAINQKIFIHHNVQYPFRNFYKTLEKILITALNTYAQLT
ncbi:SET and MYND domain-containing protein 4 [Microplitis demolitor]|uniref:SET and MYND domain-containing protein 4 n=1 Tax=Microplitis demolitor TaxID=69319 RepID=UPI0004CD71D0|nr:SET and MYND domain-containing protein 4 [Microplitis demolitor]